MANGRITLLYPEGTATGTLQFLERAGFRLLPLGLPDGKVMTHGVAADGSGKGKPAAEGAFGPIAGVITDCAAGTNAVMDWLNGLAGRLFPAPGGRPYLFLLCGERIPYGLADSIGDRIPADRMEVVRLLVLAGGDRAVIGGAGFWPHELRRRLAFANVISLLCRRVEVDEAAWALPRYLAWKRRIYQLWGERCDRVHARLDVVARALGMDKRVGQGWGIGENGGASADSYPAWWLQQQWQTVRQKANITKVAVWAAPAVMKWLEVHLAEASEVRWHIPGSAKITNNVPPRTRLCRSPAETLSDADLLMIADADETIRAFPLDDLKRRMRRAVVIDACSCYPADEAEAFGLAYRSYGQNTNIWNGILDDRI